MSVRVYEPAGAADQIRSQHRRAVEILHCLVVNVLVGWIPLGSELIDKLQQITNDRYVTEEANSS
jgi:hypothetical protein